MLIGNLDLYVWKMTMWCGVAALGCGAIGIALYVPINIELSGWPMIALATRSIVGALGLLTLTAGGMGMLLTERK